MNLIIGGLLVLLGWILGFATGTMAQRYLDLLEYKKFMSNLVVLPPSKTESKDFLNKDLQ